MSRAPGRPPIGARVTVRLPPPLLETIDRRARVRGETRAATIRSMLEAVPAGEAESGVDRAQIRRMLRLSPAERIQHAARTTRTMAGIRGAARR